jgi:hypothetical protein
MIHKCPKCEYETKNIYHLKAHLNRKTPCDNNKKIALGSTKIALGSTKIAPKNKF